MLTLKGDTLTCKIIFICVIYIRPESSPNKCNITNHLLISPVTDNKNKNLQMTPIKQNTDAFQGINTPNHLHNVTFDFSPYNHIQGNSKYI